MKKTKLIITAFCFCMAKIFAQCPSNGTHTDPTPGLAPANGGATPANGTFEQNTFDWTQPNWVSANHTWGALSNGVIGSPYYSASLTPPFASGAASNFLPGQGWELLKQDFGYFYSAGEWNGSIMGNNPIANGDPRKSPSQLNYFILYNKYSALLRVMCFINNNNAASVNTIYVKMSFLTSTDYQNSTTYKPNVSALFNHYNPSTAIALDQKTTVTEISAPCKYPGGSDMFYADFQLAYDPCTCLFQSGLNVSFYSIVTANLTLSGSYAGTTGIPWATINNNSGTVYGSQTGDEFIASVFENGGSPQSAILSYMNAEQVVSNNASQQASLNELSTGLGIASDAADALSTIPVIGAFGTITKDALDQGSKVVSFYSSQIQPAAAAAITVESGYLQATGTITFDPTLYNGVGFKLGAPGSKPPTGSTTLPEYAPAVSGEVLPNYPMYNEVTGLFALLNTPNVRHYSNDGNVEMQDSNNPGMVWAGNLNETGPDATAHVIHEYGLASSLKYALNPIINPANTAIYAGLEINGMPADDHDPGQFDTTGVSTGGIQTGYFKHHVYGMNYLDEVEAKGSANYYYRYRTPFYPLNCMQNIATRETYIYHGSQNGYQDPFREFDNPAGIVRHVTLVLLLVYEFYPDVYGKVHHGTQIIKYNCPILTESSYPFASTYSGYAPSLNLPSNLSLGATSYSGGTNTFSYGTITVNGNQINNSTANVNIQAENEVHVTGEVSISSMHAGETVLQIEGFPSYFLSCEGTLSQTNIGSLSTYCNNSGTYSAGIYNANIGAREAAPNVNKSSSVVAAKTNAIQTKLGTNLTLGIFPNPTSGVVYLNLSAQNAGGLLVNISDLNGNQVMHSNFSANEGANSFKIDLSALNSGAYFINITDENGVTIKNDKLILMGQ